MPIDPEELLPRKKVPNIVPGEDITSLSEHELAARIGVLENEIARCHAAIEERKANSLCRGFFCFANPNSMRRRLILTNVLLLVRNHV